MVERSLRQSLLISGGDLTIFVTRPISGTLVAVLVLLVSVQAALAIRRKLKK
jgi:putative tricarboxylic transport membrane protein